MPTLHDSESSRARIITGYILSVIPSLLFVFSGVMKLLGDEFMVQNFTELKLLPAMSLIGIIELLCVALYWIPKTMNLGFFKKSQEPVYLFVEVTYNNSILLEI